MFLHNKYTIWYYNIINNAAERVLDKYQETHHIIPKSLGGSDKKDNLVKLTAREHFICHWLLTKMTDYKHKQKMDYALWMMMNIVNEQQHRYKVNSKTYQILKYRLSAVFSKQHAGKKLSEETKKKISETRKRKFAEGELSIVRYANTNAKIAEKRKGSTTSQETKDKIGKAHKGKTISEEQKQYLSSLYKGKPRNDPNFKEKLSKTLKEQYVSGIRVPAKGMLGKKLSIESREKMKKPKVRGNCPYCEKEGAMNFLKRYHFDKCTVKGNNNGN